MTNSAITHAKMGRSMKNLAMRAPQRSGCESARPRGGRRRAAAPPAGGRRARRPASRAPASPARRARIFWKPSTITCSPAFRPSSTDPLAVLRAADLDRCAAPPCRRRRPPSRCRPGGERVTACCGSRMALLALACSSCTRTYMPGSSMARGLGTSARSVTWPVVGSTVRSENSSLPAGCVRCRLPAAPHLRALGAGALQRPCSSARRRFSTSVATA
jgi:hypothetical protein